MKILLRFLALIAMILCVGIAIISCVLLPAIMIPYGAIKWVITGKDFDLNKDMDKAFDLIFIVPDLIYNTETSQAK